MLRLVGSAAGTKHAEPPAQGPQGRTDGLFLPPAQGKSLHTLKLFSERYSNKQSLCHEGSE